MKNRDNSFDFLKGFLIILVVVGHAIHLNYGENSWSNPVFNIIYTFHMPFFIFISGYFFQSSLKRNFKELILNKFERLLIPAIINSLIILLILLISNKFHDITIWQLYNVSKTYWYLICLFVLTIIYYAFFKGNTITKIIIIVAYISSLFFYNRIPVFLFVDCQIIRMFLIMGLGIIYSKYKNNIHHIFVDKILTKVITVFCIVIVITVTRYYYGTNMLNYPIYIRILDGITCSIIAYIILHKTSNICQKYTPKLDKHLIETGKISLGIYLIHMVIGRFITYFKIPLIPEHKIICSILLSLLLYITSVKIIKNIKNKKVKRYLLGG